MSLILVVEDEALIRMTAADFLADAGHRVIEAANADLAVDVLEHHDDIEVVFTDINMPGSIDGLGLAELANRRWPAVRLIVASGKVPACSLHLPKGGVFLPKPYDSQSLTAALARAH